jgi:nicotinate phosphoribosyltransferase
MSEAGVKWVDFGTRRRFSQDMHDNVNAVMKTSPGFVGTSNPMLAMRHGLPAIGTYAHESIMGMQGKYGYKDANKMWMQHWLDEYGGKLGIALTDTLTTQQFLQVFDANLANRFDGVRHDSGDPFAFAEKIIKHYQELGINPKTKKIVFSDSLDPDLTIRLHQRFSPHITVMFGIGTNLSNDCEHKALNMVIKMIKVDFGQGMKDVVKLSDVPGKHTGDVKAITQAKKELGV